MCKQPRIHHACGHEVEPPLETCKEYPGCGEPKLLVQQVLTNCPSCEYPSNVKADSGKGAQPLQSGGSAAKVLSTGLKHFARSAAAFPGTDAIVPRGRGAYDITLKGSGEGGPKVPRGRGAYDITLKGSEGRPKVPRGRGNGYDITFKRDSDSEDEIAEDW